MREKNYRDNNDLKAIDCDGIEATQGDGSVKVYSAILQ